MDNPADLSELEKKIAYSFRRADLLETALTHSSYANEHKENGIVSNERLEFLGDAVTGLEIALLLFEEAPQMDEGRLTTARATLIQSESLSMMARSFDLGKYLRLGVGADKTAIRENDAVLEDAFEALMGAIFLDGGINAARNVIRMFFAQKVDDTIQNTSNEGYCEDYKSRLQAEVQRDGMANIQYIITNESGPDHDKRFCVAVMCNGKKLGTGVGKTKKQAEKLAAKMALENIKCI